MPYLGNFYEWNCMQYDNQEQTNTDPWIPRNTTTLMSEYFCVKNEYSSQSSPKTKNAICTTCISSMKRNSLYQKGTLTPNINCPDTLDTNHSKLKLISQHCRKFCETTSMRGVPKIVNSRRYKYRCLWAIFVLVFFIANVTCLILLINQYRGYDVIHQPKTSFNTPADFPSITFCNLRPFSGRTVEYLKINNMKTLNQFLRDFRGSFPKRMKTLNLNLSNEVGLLQTAAMSLNQFLMNLPPSVDVDSIGHSLKSMIIDCRVSYINGSELSGLRCEKAGTWMLSRNEVYLNCHTLTLWSDFLKNAKAVDITLHIDDRFDFECPDCMNTLPLFQMTGIRFSLHTAHTYPDVLDEGNNLSPGTFTEAVFHSKEWNMMEPPYGKCSKGLVNVKYSFEEGDFLYTLPSCKIYTIQQNLYKYCGCIKYNHVPKNLMHLQKNKDVCTYIEQPVFNNVSNFDINLKSLLRLFNRTKCRKDISHQFPHDYTICAVPCQYYTFETSISSGIYPTKSYHLRFWKYVRAIINRNIADSKTVTERKELKKILDKLHIYSVIESEIKKGNKTLAEHLLKQADVIEKNFLTIQINRQNLNIIKVEEKAVISITSLLSQAGGMFSIWSGITFFLIVEFIELFMNIMETVFEIKS